MPRHLVHEQSDQHNRLFSQNAFRRGVAIVREDDGVVQLDLSREKAARSGYALVDKRERFGSEVGGQMHLEAFEDFVEQIVVQTLQHAQVGVVKHPAGRLEALQHPFGESEDLFGALQIIEAKQIVDHQAGQEALHAALRVRGEGLHPAAFAQRGEDVEGEELAVDELHFCVCEEAVDVVQRGGDGDAELRAERREVVHDLQGVADVHARVELGERARERGHLADAEVAQEGGFAQLGGHAANRGAGGRRQEQQELVAHQPAERGGELEEVGVRRGGQPAGDAHLEGGRVERNDLEGTRRGGAGRRLGGQC